MLVELTKQHKVLAGILLLGAGAVVLDRTVLSSGISGPDQAAAAITSSSTNRVCDTAPSTSLESLTTRVSRLDGVAIDQAAVANAFVVPSGWAVNDKITQESGVVGSDSAATGQFRLSSVMTRPVVAAVVNGHMIRVGQSYAFGAGSDGKFGLLKQEELRQQQKSGGAGINSVRLISVEPRSQDNSGSAAIEVDGVRISLAIEQSEKHK